MLPSESNPHAGNETLGVKNSFAQGFREIVLIWSVNLVLIDAIKLVFFGDPVSRVDVVKGIDIYTEHLLSCRVVQLISLAISPCK
jgi:hypothetical protein